MAEALTTGLFTDIELAVLIPCFNEQNTIRSVVENFRSVLPNAGIYVYDNNSTDQTVSVARDAGAIVRSEQLQGKGNVVRRMFADIEADVYVLVDGDDTYSADSCRELVAKLIENDLDMVNAARVADSDDAYRPRHQFGNALLTTIVGTIFGKRFKDILSGYRVFSRRFVKSFPALSSGFEIETELTVHALELRMPVAEVDTPYKARPEDSVSKLNTYTDGWKILKTIMILSKEERPLKFFSLLSALFALTSVILVTPIVITWLETGLVPRFPTAILSASLMVLAFLGLVCGLVLDTVTTGRREMKRIAYLGIPLRRS
jgi:glycosyltransferase involved in cell wall biosynthesis